MEPLTACGFRVQWEWREYNSSVQAVASQDSPAWDGPFGWQSLHRHHGEENPYMHMLGGSQSF